MILPVKKIVEEFYHNTSRLKKNYSVATVKCSHLDKKWFFMLFHTSPVVVNFVNFSVC